MGRISYTKSTDGTSADVIDVNAPLDTIYNEFNGNIDGTNMKSDITLTNLTVGGTLTVGTDAVSIYGGTFRSAGFTSTITGASGSFTPALTASIFTVTALGAAATIAAPSGTPVDGYGFMLRIKDNGTPRALTWNAIYRAIGITLPTTTVANKTMYIAMRYNGVDSKWDVLSVARES